MYPITCLEWLGGGLGDWTGWVGWVRVGGGSRAWGPERKESLGREIVLLLILYYFKIILLSFNLGMGF